MKYRLKHPKKSKGSCSVCGCDLNAEHVIFKTDAGAICKPCYMKKFIEKTNDNKASDRQGEERLKTLTDNGEAMECLQYDE